MARLIAVLTVTVGAWTLGPPAVAVGQETPPILMTFDLYTTARAARASMAADSAAVSALVFEGASWRYTVWGIRGGPATSHEPSDECHSRLIDSVTGVTGCALYTVARAQQEAMGADGWDCSLRLRINGDAHQWEFTWRRRR
jgi:hypothetical protein